MISAIFLALGLANWLVWAVVLPQVGLIIGRHVFLETACVQEN